MIMSPLAALFAALTLASACISSDPHPTRKCEFTGKERFAVNLDGVIVGAFESYSVAGNVATFTNGVIPPSRVLNAWREFNLSSPRIPETHDLLIFATSNGTLGDAVAELRETTLADIVGSPSSDRPDCLIVSSLQIRVKVLAGTPTGVITR
jgi:hypothetical protein